MKKEIFCLYCEKFWTNKFNIFTQKYNTVLIFWLFAYLLKSEFFIAIGFSHLSSEF